MDHLQKTKIWIPKSKETDDSRYIYQSELNKACLQHEMAIGYFKDLTRRTASDKILRDKAFDTAKNPKYDGYQKGLASMVYKFFDKKTAGGAVMLARSNTLATIRDLSYGMKIFQTINHLKYYTNQSLKNLRKEKYTHLL